MGERKVMLDKMFYGIAPDPAKFDGLKSIVKILKNKFR